MFGDAPYKFSKLSNYICHRHADGNEGAANLCNEMPVRKEAHLLQGSNQGPYPLSKVGSANYSAKKHPRA